MHVNRGLLGWGVFFIVLGAVPLAVRSGVVAADTALRAWQLWPLLLIGAGIGLVLARTRAAIVGGLVVAVTGGLMAGGALASAMEGFPGGFQACGGPGAGTPFAEQRGDLSGTARVSVSLDCGSVEIASGPGTAWNVSGTSGDGQPPTISSSSDRLTVEGRTRQTIDLADAGVAWTIALPADPVTRFDLTVNAGSARASFDGMRLDRVSADVNAGSALLDLSGATEAGTIGATVNAGSLSVVLPSADLSGSLAANAGSLQVCAPAGIDLRIRLQDNALGSNNLAEAGLEQSGDTWTTPGYGTGSAQVDLTATANLGSITLDPEGGCE
jgi:hypothetical protein